MNYFLQNHVGAILKQKLPNVHYLKSITDEVKRNIRNENKPLYVRLINAYVNKVEDLDLLAQYGAMLWEMFLKNEENVEFASEEWMTLIRLKMVALIFLVHLHSQNRRDILYSIHDLWKTLYPDDGLPHKEQKKRVYTHWHPDINPCGEDEFQMMTRKKIKLNMEVLS